MTEISATLKRRYVTVSEKAQASIHRHPQADVVTELQRLANAASASDDRDTYGLGGTITAFEQQLCQLFNKPGAVFLPTGTLAQCAAVKCFSEQSGRNGIGLHPTSHLLLHENMAVEQLWGLQAHVIGNPATVFTCADLKDLKADVIAAVIVELPMREIGGELPTWEALVEIRRWCDARGVKMHMDGARIWQVTEFYRRSLADIAALFDSVYVSFYKDMGGIFGAALLGESALISAARVWARRAGGNPITQYVEAIAARGGLQTYLSRMPAYVAYTKLLTGALVPLVQALVPEQPKAAMFHLVLPFSPMALTMRVVDYAERTGVVVLPLPRAGDEHSCTCEVSVGENACAQSPEFWAGHISACLAGE